LNDFLQEQRGMSKEVSKDIMSRNWCLFDTFCSVFFHFIGGHGSSCIVWCGECNWSHHRRVFRPLCLQTWCPRPTAYHGRLVNSRLHSILFLGELCWQECKCKYLNKSLDAHHVYVNYSLVIYKIVHVCAHRLPLLLGSLPWVEWYVVTLENLCILRPPIWSRPWCPWRFSVSCDAGATGAVNIDKRLPSRLEGSCKCSC
jgi:hypothetical protein